jgi:hypothetical protein
LPVITPPTNNRRCHDCGSPLVLQAEDKMFIENSYSETTVATYVCSNNDCQARKDAVEAKRVQGVKDEIERKKKIEESKKL